MGYTTDFDGSFTITPQLTTEHRNYLNEFAETRRVKRDPDVVARTSDPLREAVRLPPGRDGGYCVNSANDGIIDFNRPPGGQPGLWCDWIPNEDGTALEWDLGEKFYNYDDWLVYLIEHFLAPWGYTLNGTVYWYGEEAHDLGRLVVTNNHLSVQHGSIVYGDDAT